MSYLLVNSSIQQAQMSILLDLVLNGPEKGFENADLVLHFIWYVIYGLVCLGCGCSFFLYIQKLNDWTTPGKMLAKLVIIRVTFETSVEKLQLLNTLNLMNWKWFSFLYAIILPRVILSDIFLCKNKSRCSIP